MQETDVAIIGAGPAGAIAAGCLARKGKKVVVLEKERFPRFVIGESLLPRTNDILEKCGFYPAVEKAGFLYKGGAVFYKGEKREQFNFDERFHDGWDFAYNVPRADFDKLLADEAEKMGADIQYKVEVKNVEFPDDGVILRCENLDHKNDLDISAKFLIDCSGYGRVLPKLLGLDEVSSLDFRESLFTHIKNDIRPTGKDEGYIWIVDLPQGGWIWVIPFSNGVTSVGVVGKPSIFENVSGSDDEVLRTLLMQEPKLGERLKNMEFVMPSQRIKGYSIGIKQIFGDRYLLTGNATEFLDPVFSSGVTLAMESAYKAQGLVYRFLEGEEIDFQKEYSDYLMKGVDCFRVYINAWYEQKLGWLFYSQNKPKRVKDRICSVLAGYAWDDNNAYAFDAANSLNAAINAIPPELRV